MPLFADLLERFRTATGTATDWPPHYKRADWETIGYYRARFENDPGLILPYAEQYSGASHDKRQTFTPIPLAREICRYSAALLFSEPVKVTLPVAEPDTSSGNAEPAPKPAPTANQYQGALDDLMEANALDPFWQQSAETVAIEGRGAVRIIRDDRVSKEPLLTYVHEDEVLWYESHGRFVTGGAVIIEHEPRKGVVLRLVEEHEAGVIRRSCYRGDTSRLGSKVDLNQHPEGEGLKEVEQTGLDVPTLIRWDNIPGGYSDLFAIEVLLDRLDEAESIFVDKGRKSSPVVFAHRSLADEQGNIVGGGVILVGDDSADLGVLGEGPKSLPIELVQPALQTAETIAWIDHLREMALTLAGYALSSWGLDRGGSADSGKALKLRQARTLLTRAAKERMAREAIVNSLATALAWKLGQSDIAPLRPQVEFGSGLPRDEVELAQVISVLRAAEVQSVEEGVKMFNPSWTEKEIAEEIERLDGAAEKPDPIRDALRSIGTPNALPPETPRETPPEAVPNV